MRARCCLRVQKLAAKQANLTKDAGNAAPSPKPSQLLAALAMQLSGGTLPARAQRKPQAVAAPASVTPKPQDKVAGRAKTPSGKRKPMPDEVVDAEIVTETFVVEPVAASEKATTKGKVAKKQTKTATDKKDSAGLSTPSVDDGKPSWWVDEAEDVGADTADSTKQTPQPAVKAKKKAGAHLTPAGDAASAADPIGDGVAVEAAPAKGSKKLKATDDMEAKKAKGGKKPAFTAAEEAAKDSASPAADPTADVDVIEAVETPAKQKKLTKKEKKAAKKAARAAKNASSATADDDASVFAEEAAKDSVSPAADPTPDVDAIEAVETPAKQKKLTKKEKKAAKKAARAAKNASSATADEDVSAFAEEAAKDSALPAADPTPDVDAIEAVETPAKQKKLTKKENKAAKKAAAKEVKQAKIAAKKASKAAASEVKRAKKAAKKAAKAAAKAAAPAKKGTAASSLVAGESSGLVTQDTASHVSASFDMLCQGDVPSGASSIADGVAWRARFRAALAANETQNALRASPLHVLTQVKSILANTPTIHGVVLGEACVALLVLQKTQRTFLDSVADYAALPLLETLTQAVARLTDGWLSTADDGAQAALALAVVQLLSTGESKAAFVEKLTALLLEWSASCPETLRTVGQAVLTHAKSNNMLKRADQKVLRANFGK